LAVKRDINTDLTLEIGGTSVTPDKFLRGVRSFFALLSEVTIQIAGKRDGVQWRVLVREGSNLIGVDAEPGFDPSVVGKIIAVVSEGVSALEHNAVHPAFFSERAVRSMGELADLVGTTESDNTTVRLWAKRKPIPVTHKSVAHVSQLFSSEHEDHGSIEGRLRTITEQGGLQFVVYEPLWDQPVRCRIPERLIDRAMENFRKRVEVYGLIRYRKDGKPISIQVDDIVAFPSDDQIPSFQEVHGILREAS
jgi:hypothetical protein